MLEVVCAGLRELLSRAEGLDPRYSGIADRRWLLARCHSAETHVAVVEPRSASGGDSAGLLRCDGPGKSTHGSASRLFQKTLEKKRNSPLVIFLMVTLFLNRTKALLVFLC